MEFINVERAGTVELGSLNQERLEKLVNNALSVAIQKSTPDESISFLLESIGKIIKGHRVYIIEQNERGNLDNTYEWAAAGVTCEKEHLQNIPADTFAIWNDSFRNQHMVVIEDIEHSDMIDDKVYACLKPQNISSLVVVPFSLHFDMDALSLDMDIDGFFGIDNPPAGSLEHAKTLLHIIRSFLLGAIKRRNLVRELQQQSMLDQQTHLGNRYAMNKFLEQQDVFNEYGIYRIGGDEFLVIYPDTDANTLQEKAHLLRKTALENDVNFAIGTSWTADRTAFDSVMAQAEKNMYADKRLYYQQSGLDRRCRS